MHISRFEKAIFILFCSVSVSVCARAIYACNVRAWLIMAKDMHKHSHTESRITFYGDFELLV